MSAVSLQGSSVIATDIGNLKKNLLPANVSTGTDTLGTTAGFFGVQYANGNRPAETLSVSTIQWFGGSNSLKVITDGGWTHEGIYVSVPGLIIGATYTLSLRLYAPNSTPMYTAASGVYNNFTANGAWQYVTQTFTANATTQSITFAATQSNPIITFYVDQLQLELGSTATAWTMGNLLSYNQQTVETNLTGLNGTGAIDAILLERSTTESYQGSASADVNVTSIGTNGYFSIGMPYGSGSPLVTVGKTYTGIVKSKYNKNGHTNPIYVYARIRWYDSGSNYINADFNGLQTLIDKGWINLTVTGTAPTNAYYGVLSVVATPSNNSKVGDKLYWDDAWFVENTGANISLSQRMNGNSGIVTSDSANISKKFSLTGYSDIVSTAIGSYGLRKRMTANSNLLVTNNGSMKLRQRLNAVANIITQSSGLIHDKEDLLAYSDIVFTTSAVMSVNKGLTASSAIIVDTPDNTLNLRLSFNGQSDILISDSGNVTVVRPHIDAIEDTVIFDSVKTVSSLDTPPPVSINFNKNKSSIKFNK